MKTILVLSEEEKNIVNKAMDARIHKCRNQLDTLTAMLESLAEVGIVIQME